MSTDDLNSLLRKIIDQKPPDEESGEITKIVGDFQVPNTWSEAIEAGNLPEIVGSSVEIRPESWHVVTDSVSTVTHGIPVTEHAHLSMGVDAGGDYRTVCVDSDGRLLCKLSTDAKAMVPVDAKTVVDAIASSPEILAMLSQTILAKWRSEQNAITTGLVNEALSLDALALQALADACEEKFGSVVGAQIGQRFRSLSPQDGDVFVLQFSNWIDTREGMQATQKLMTNLRDHFVAKGKDVYVLAVPDSVRVELYRPRGPDIS